MLKSAGKDGFLQGLVPVREKEGTYTAPKGIFLVLRQTEYKPAR